MAIGKLCLHLIAKIIRNHMIKFIGIDLELYKIFKIMQVSFFGTHCRFGLAWIGLAWLPKPAVGG